jgi:hypothetical protein
MRNPLLFCAYAGLLACAGVVAAVLGGVL